MVKRDSNSFIRHITKYEWFNHTLNGVTKTADGKTVVWNLLPILYHQICVLYSLCIVMILKCNKLIVYNLLGFSDCSVVKNAPVNGGDMGFIPQLGRSPGEGNGNPLQYSCLGNLIDRRTLWATVHWIARVRKWLSD